MPLQLAADNFQRGAEDPLSDGGNWLITTGQEGMQLTSSGVVSCISLGGATDFQYFNGGITWPNDQYSQIGLRTNNISPNTASGAMVRIAAAVNTRYQAVIINGSLILGKVVAGTFTSLSSVSYSFTNGDVMYFEAKSTTLNAKMNGTLKATTTDSSITSGFPGFFMLTSTGMTGNVNSTNWSGGAADIGSAATQAWPIIV